MTSKSYSKDDLKRLMQERKEEQSKKKRIDSPLAGYDTDGNLYCKICEFKIENVNLWTRHLVSKEHKLVSLVCDENKFSNKLILASNHQLRVWRKSKGKVRLWNDNQNN